MRDQIFNFVHQVLFFTMYNYPSYETFLKQKLRTPFLHPVVLMKNIFKLRSFRNLDSFSNRASFSSWNKIWRKLFQLEDTKFILADSKFRQSWLHQFMNKVEENFVFFDISTQEKFVDNVIKFLEVKFLFIHYISNKHAFYIIWYIYMLCIFK